jgi:hypothetical protein
VPADAPSETFLCTHCGERLPAARRSVEHPLSQAIGGQGWSTSDVCDACNARGGREVDGPFASEPFILAARHRHRVPDPRGEVLPPPRLYGKLENGLPMYVELGRDGASVHRVPAPEHRDESSERYTVDVGEAEALVRKRIERIRAQRGDSVEVDFTIETVRQAEAVGNIAYSLKTSLWPRFGAKVGLAFGRELLGESWLSTPQAAHLRDVLAGGESEPAEGLPPLSPLWDDVEPDDLYHQVLAPPPAHLLMAVSTERGVGLLLQLFGEFRYRIPLSPARGEEVHNRAWIFDPIVRSARETTLSGLVEAAIRRKGPDALTSLAFPS